MQKRASLKDIAEKVGVSVALVSYVLNNRMEGRINKEVAARIRKTAEQLNYQPNQIAKSLKTRKTNTIGLIVSDIANPFSSMLARIVEDEADRHGYTVILGSSDENPVKSQKLIDTLLNRQVDGLLIAPPAGSEEQIRQLIKKKIPFVLVDRYFTGIDAGHVNVDDFNAAYEGVSHLVSTGKKRIGMIAYNTTLINLKEREKGYLSALKKAKLAKEKQWLQRVDSDREPAEIEKALDKLLLGRSPVNALIFASNRIAVAALKYIEKLQLKIPEALALITFDEAEVFDFFHPPLTYIQQPLEAIGQKATRMLINNMDTIQKPEQVFIPARLVIRGSTVKH